MRTIAFVAITLSAIIFTTGCPDAGIPQPIKVLENPGTGERARFYKEIWHKVPSDYDREKHVAEWTADQKKAGFTHEISPEDDRDELAAQRVRNRATAQRAQPFE
jgi:hypothetical protein